MPTWLSIVLGLITVGATVVIGLAAWRTMEATKEIARLTEGSWKLYELERDKRGEGKRRLAAEIARLTARVYLLDTRVDLGVKQARSGLHSGNVEDLRILVIELRVLSAESAVVAPAATAYLQLSLVGLESLVTIAERIHDDLTEPSLSRTHFAERIHEVLRIAGGGLVQAFQQTEGDAALISTMKTFLDRYTAEAARALQEVEMGWTGDLLSPLPSPGDPPAS